MHSRVPSASPSGTAVNQFATWSQRIRKDGGRTCIMVMRFSTSIVYTAEP